MVVQDLHSAQIGEDILPFELGYLPEKYRKKAEIELHETPEKIVQCRRQLREMMKLDKRLSHLDFDDDYLLQMLRSRKFNVERTFAGLKNYVSFTHKTPESYTNFKFDETVKFFEHKFVSVMPWRCHEGSTVIVVELDKWKPSVIPVDEVKRSLVVLILLCLREPMTQVNGFKVIFDVKSSNPLRYIRIATPHNIWLLFYGVQEVMPGRFKAIHFVNDSLTFKTGWLIGKHFFSEKLISRIHFHSSRAELVHHFPRAVLPSAFGGDLENYDQTAWLKKAMAPEELAKLGGGALKGL